MGCRRVALIDMEINRERYRKEEEERKRERWRAIEINNWAEGCEDGNVRVYERGDRNKDKTCREIASLLRLAYDFAFVACVVRTRRASGSRSEISQACAHVCNVLSTYVHMIILMHVVILVMAHVIILHGL